MVEKVPSARESISWNRSVTSFKEAQMGVVSVTVESMGFTLVPEEAGIGREMQVLSCTGSDLASIRLQMGVQVFAVPLISISQSTRSGGLLLVGTFLCCGRVVARVFAIGKGAVVFSIALGRQSIVWVIPRSPNFGIILGPSDRLSHG
jgi:hypothetical protein